MTELIKVTVTEDNQQLVSARDLHKGLDNKERFSKWFERMISYGFEENTDYTPYQNVHPLNNQEITDYVITLDMAKEISMIQRTDIGKQFRQYFIQREKDAAAFETIITHTDSQQTLQEFNDYRFSIKKTITTFQYTDPLKLPGLIQEFNDYIATLPTQTRLTRYQSAIKGIERIQTQIDAKTIHLMPLVLVEKEKLHKALHKLENKRNGGQKASKTKLIHKLQQNQDPTPDISQFHKINTHGFSHNFMYCYVDGKTVRTAAYNRWIRNFPTHELPDNLYFDKEKPARLYVYYTAKPEVDIKNLDKSFIDRLQDIYGFNDNIIDQCISKRYEACSTYAEGEIYFYIENIEEGDNAYEQ